MIQAFDERIELFAEGLRALAGFGDFDRVFEEIDVPDPYDATAVRLEPARFFPVLGVERGAKMKFFSREVHSLIISPFDKPTKRGLAGSSPRGAVSAEISAAGSN